MHKVAQVNLRALVLYRCPKSLICTMWIVVPGMDIFSETMVILKNRPQPGRALSNQESGLLSVRSLIDYTCCPHPGL